MELLKNCCHCKRPKQSQYISFIIILAVVIKLSLLVFTAINAPQGKFLPDSPRYLELSTMLASKGVFAIQNEGGHLLYETFRTPGYPLFLAMFNGLMRIPLNGVIFLQIIMTLVASFIVYKTALMIDQKIALLSMTIILLDPPITIFSLTILTETLFLLLISLFMLCFTLYLKHRKIGFIVSSALILGAATYVRPISYYLGFAGFLFILYANMYKNYRKYLIHTFIFIAIVYSITGLWQVRNYIRCHNTAFCSAERSNLSTAGLFKSYTRNKDPYTKDMAPLPYYINVSFRSLMSVMTKPGTFKYFGSDMLTVVGKILGYPWMAFWLSGFIIGAIRMKRNIYIQFMLFVALYFITASVGAQMWIMGDKLRVSMMPFIAIISAYGWKALKE